MRRLRAKTASRRYDVLIGRGCLQELGGALWTRSPGGEVLVGCDENVAPLYLEPVRDALRDAGCSVSQVVIPAGERQKSLARAEELYGVLYDRGLRRGDTILALGGGVVGDLFGFVAATYQRGMHVVQAPTTLLAQVDAAIGGKVAVDFRAGKNYVGTFYQPRLVFVDVATLDTLPGRELKSGAAEVAKYGLLGGGELLERCEALGAGGLTAAAVAEDLVAGCVQAKLDVVAADEREETGKRAVLNLGHTLGHAVEAAGQFSRFTHGEAVALGLRAALWLSERLTGLDTAEAARGLSLLESLGLPGRLNGVRADAVCELVGRDKKAGRDGVGYVLLEALGKPVTGVTVPAELEREAVEWLLELKRLWVLHGVNLDMLGYRNPVHYGALTLPELERAVTREAETHGLMARCYQTNHEGELIERLHEIAREGTDAVLINPGAWTHYSYALRDALELIAAPVAEVHLSGVEAREEWRRRSVIADLAAVRVSGKGVDGYLEAVRELARIVKDTETT